MFSVLFEVTPREGQWDAYLGYAKLLRPELERIDGFVDNIRYRSLRREGTVLSLSSWRDEKSLVRWRTHAPHHGIQGKGRSDVFRDYHLRVGQVTQDSRVPAGYALTEQRLEETEAGEARSVVLIDIVLGAERMKTLSPEDAAAALGLAGRSSRPVAWDVFDAVLTPGNAILLTSWKDSPAAAAFLGEAALPEGARSRTVRVVRDYGMFDRREAPQYYPEVHRV